MTKDRDQNGVFIHFSGSAQKNTHYLQLLQMKENVVLGFFLWCTKMFFLMLFYTIFVIPKVTFAFGTQKTQK